MGRVVYLTGAPATGKSTLCTYLADNVPNLTVYSYSRMLRDHISKGGAAAVDEGDIRRQSAAIVTREAVAEIDRWLVADICEKRHTQHAVIDSHAVTKESYGFRITPFSPAQFAALAPDVIICLYAAPEVIVERIRARPAGRPLTSLFETSLHIELQAAVVVQYGFSGSTPLYMIDSASDVEAVAASVIRLAGLDR